MNSVFLAVKYARMAIREHNKVELKRCLEAYDLSKYHHEFFNLVLMYDFVSAVSCFVSYINVWLTNDMYYAVHLAKSREMIKELVRLGARLNVKTIGGLSPLHTARNMEVVKELLRYGMDVNVCDSKGVSPLKHYIQIYDFMEFISSFVENCNPTIPSVGRSDFNWFFETEKYFYFMQKLPQRHAHCLKVVLLLIGTKAFRYKDVTLMIARLVWKTRRDPCWD